MRGSCRALSTLAAAAILAAATAPPAALAQPAPPPAASQPATAPIGFGVAPATAPVYPPLTGAPINVEVRVPSATRPATTQLSLNFKDASVDAVLEYLSDAAGYTIVKEVPVSGRISVISKQPINSDDAINLLNTVLKVNGYTAIRMGKTLKITEYSRAKKGNIPVHIGNKPEDIAMTDELITQVIPVTKVDAVKLKQDLVPLIGPEADVSANGGSNSIIVTDTSASIRRIVEIVHNLDQQTAQESDILVKQLKYADATAAARLIKEIFAPTDQNAQGGNNNNPFAAAFGRRFGGGGGGGPGGGGGGAGGAAAGSEAANLGKVVASADDRTNTIVVSGPPASLKVIDRVITELDANPAEESTFFIYNLKNAQAANLQDVINAMFGSTGTNRSTTGRNGTSQNTGVRSTGSAFGGSSGTGSGSRSGSGGSGGRSGSGGSGSGTLGSSGTTGTNASQRGGFGATGTGGVGGTGNVSRGSQQTASDLAGQVYVVANADTNSLLVQTAAKYADRVKAVLAELDRAVPQVLIKVLIAEVTHDNSADFGVDFSILNKRPSGNGASFGSNLGNAAQTGGLVVNLIEQNVTATLHALATQGKLDVLSRPYILTSDNQPASITVGQEVPFITDTRTDALGQQINTIQYQDIGIILNVTPHINSEGLVILDVDPEISQLTGITVPISSTVSAPVFAKRSASSRVGIMNGQTIVIGGLMEDRKTSTISKVPLLGDIPVLGQLFRRTQIDKQKTELLIFLTPHVALQPETLQPMSRDELKGTQLTPNAVQPGTFDDHMRGMRRGGRNSPETNEEQRNDDTKPPVGPDHSAPVPTTP